MSPIGLLIILLSINSFTNGKPNLNNTQYDLGKDLIQVFNEISNLLDLKCLPGEFEENEGECHKCFGYDDTCTDTKECCGLEHMYCDLKFNKCDCLDPYKYVKDRKKCIHKDDIVHTEELLIIYIPVIVIFGIVMPTLYCLIKKYGYPHRSCLELIRDRVEECRNPRVRNTTPNLDTRSPVFTRTYGNNDLSRQYNARSTDLTRSQIQHNITSNPSNVCPPPQYARDLPPDYNEVTSVAVSPPPEYNYAVGIQVSKK